MRFSAFNFYILSVFFVAFFLLSGGREVSADDGLMNGKFLTGETDNFLLWLQTYDKNTAPYYFDRFFISKTGNVGIGTSAPATQLYIAGTGIARNNTLSFSNNYDLVNKGYVDSFVNASIATATSSITLWGGNTGGNIWSLNSGNVGIGTSNPGDKLVVYNGAFTKYTSTGIDGTTDSLLKFGYFNDLQPGGTGNTNRYQGIDATITAGAGSANKMLFKLFQGGANNVAPATVMTLQGDGNVGVGTTNPQVKLEVRGTASNTIDSTNAVSKIVGNVGASVGLYTGSLAGTPNYATWIQSMRETDNLPFQLLINPLGGNVGIGTTAPATQLYVNGTGIARNNTMTFGNDYDLINKGYADALVGASIAAATSTITLWGGSTSGNVWSLNSGNVGIGITNPSYKLHVDGSFRVNKTGSPTEYFQTTGSSFELYSANSAATPFVINLTGSTGLIADFQDSGASVLAIANDGKVGVGTTNPGAKFEVSNGGAEGISLTPGSSSNILAYNRSTSTYSPLFIGAQVLTFGGGGSAEHIRITTGGNVGIGTTSPGAKLHVNGDIGVDDIGKIRFLKSDNTNTGFISSYDELDGIKFGEDRGTYSTNIDIVNDKITFSTGASAVNKVVINTSGNVGIGTTALGDKLEVVGAARFNPYTSAGSIGSPVFQDAIKLGPSANSAIIQFGNEFQSTHGSYINFQVNSASAQNTPVNVMTFNPSGNVGIGTTAPATQLYINGTGIARNNTMSFGNDYDLINKGYADALVGASIAAATSSITLWGGSTSGNVWSLNSGNVGVGTTNPTTKLTVWGALSVGESLPGVIGNSRIYKGTSPVSVRQEFGTDNSGWQYRIAKNAGGTITDLLTVQDNGNLGIGSTSPAYKLSVVGSAIMLEGNTGNANIIINDIANRNASIRFNSAGTTQWTIGRGDSDELPASSFFIGTGATGGANSKLAIDSSGNVGIGTTAPATQLYVNGTGIARNNTLSFSNSYDLINKGYVDSLVAAATSSITLWGGTTGGNVWNLNSGNVGIGTTNPNTLLTVGSNVSGSLTAIVPTLRVQGMSVISSGNSLGYGSYGGILLNSNTSFTSTARRYMLTNSLLTNRFAIIRSTDALTDPVIGVNGVLSSGTADFVINNTGDVGIGTTNPGAKLDIAGPANGSGANLRTVGDIMVGTGTGATIFFDGNYNYAAGNYIRALTTNTQTFVTSGSERLRIASNGNIGIASSSPSAQLVVAGTGIARNTTMSFSNDYDLVNRGYVNAVVATATSSITLWGGTTGGNVWNLNSGNIGIGTTNPGAYKLNVSGNTYLNGDLTVSGLIAGVKNKTNTVRNNLGSPTVQEMALFHGQFNNKFRFIPPTLQEESTDGSTWVPSSRASANTLADLMIGEGQSTSFNAIPAPAIGGSGYYRLTWDNAATGVGYVFLNDLYVYNSTNGNNVTFTIEQYHNTNGWSTVTSGTISNWPGHTEIPHTSIPFSTSASQYGKVRVTFSITNATYANPFNLYAIEWFGGYPAGRRNAEYYDRDRNVTFPAAIRGGAGSVGVPSFSFSSDTNSGMYSGGSDILKLVTGGADRLTILSNGNVGIGTTAPATQLYINGTGIARNNTMSFSNNYDLVNKGYVDALAPGGASSLWSGTKDGNIWNGTSGAGNVGIGTNNPNSKLQISSTISNVTGGEQYGTYIGATFSADDTGMKQGLRLTTTASNSGTIANTYGLVSLMSNTGTGTTTSATSVWSRVDVSAGRRVENAYNFVVNNGSITGTMGNQYGLYVAPLSGATNNFAVYTASTTPSYFGGNVGIGVTNPGTLLDLQKDTSSGSYGQYPSFTVSNLNTTGTSYAAAQFRSGNVSAVGVTGLVGRFLAYSNNNAGQYFGIYSASSTYPLYLGNNNNDLTIKSGNVGIGTTNPTAKLYINSGGGANSGVVIRSDGSTGEYASLDYVNKNNVRLQTGLYDSGDAFFYMSSAGNKIGFYTNDLQRMTIAKDGNVGLGTTAPATQLYINGTGIARNNTLSFSNDYDLINKGYLDAAIDSVLSGDSDSLWSGTKDGTIWNGTSGAGNVGIGTTTPGYKLDVYGSGTLANFGNGITGGIKIGDSFISKTAGSGFSWGSGLIPAADNDAYLGMSTKRWGYMYVGNLSTSKISDTTFLTNGNVGISTSSPAYKLDVFGAIRSNNLKSSGASYVMADANGQLYPSNSPIQGVITYNRTTFTTNYTAASTDYILAFTGTSANVTVTLPDSLCTNGRAFVITNESGGSYNVTVDPEGATQISGLTSKTLRANEAIPVYCGGSKWFIY